MWDVVVVDNGPLYFEWGWPDFATPRQCLSSTAIICSVRMFDFEEMSNEIDVKSICVYFRFMVSELRAPLPNIAKLS
jgi:hypothetical protein